MELNIFLPFKNKHAYLNEIQRYSSSTFNYLDQEEYNSSFKAINIHWPEELFNWKEPKPEDLVKLEKTIKGWKRSSKIVYTKHDKLRTKGSTPLFTRLYELVEENTDVFIHLGEFSKKLYQAKFPGAKHEIIYHPLYKESFKKYEKSKARKKLEIDKSAMVIIAPGNIRHLEERRLVFQAFKNLNISNKALVCTNMRNELEFDFPGRVKLQRIFDLQQYVKKRFLKNHQAPLYYFNYSPMSSDDLSLRMSAADVVLVPRMDILNSGIVFLGASFNKVVVGPRTGNITEQLEEQNLPVFNPYSKSSVAKAVKEGIEIFKRGDFQWKNVEKYQPENIAQQYDKIFTESIRKL